MSLTTRLLLHSQVALAVVLAVLCVGVPVAAHWYVRHQAAETAERAVATLVASVDIEPDSVEWEPSDREVVLGTGPLGEAAHWVVTDARGEMVDRSPNATTDELVGSGWAVVRRMVHPPGAAGEQLTRNRTTEEVEKGEYPALVFTAGVRIAPLLAAADELAVGLAGGSLLVWLAAFAVGRWVCQRALRPVTALADAARSLNVEDATARIPPVTTRGELEDLRNAMGGMLDRLHAALARERRFTAEASHQLRTPLGVILGQVDVALRRPRPADEYERVLGVVRRQASDLARSVEALLFLARSDAPPPAVEVIDLREWVPEYVRSLAAHPRVADVSFAIEPDRLLRVSAHPPLLRELVGNLVENALKYSPAGTPIELSVTDNDGVCLAVADRGPGVAPADLPHLFEPFYRAAGTLTVPGSGLGLAVVARIAAAFGGQVTADNRSGGGARFALTLPHAG